MSEDYLRQRRNFLSISIIILLVILGGTDDNPISILKLKNTCVATIFMWIGFFYFWYRLINFTPSPLSDLFKNEIFISTIKVNDSQFYYHKDLSSFVGKITLYRENANDINSKFYLNLIGTSSVGAVDGNSKIGIMNEIQVLNNRNYIINIFKGTVFTNYFLPHILAFTVLVLGNFFYHPCFPEIILFISSVVLFIYFISSLHEID